MLEPTLGGLEYCYPRLSPGGIVVANGDDALAQPQVREAWDRFRDERDIAFVVPGSGQAVIIRA